MHIGWEGEAFSAGLPTPAVAQWGVGHFGWDGECRVGAKQDEICSAGGLAHLGVSGSNQHLKARLEKPLFVWLPTR